MLINIYKVGGKQMGPGSAQWCPETGHKLEHGKFQLNMRKNFSTVRVPEPWHRLHREMLESPSLEISKPTWMVSCATCCREPG